MKKVFIWVFVFLLLVSLGIGTRVEALNNIDLSTVSYNSVDNNPYVPGEIIVKFRKDKIDLNATFSLSSKVRELIFNWTKGYETEDTIKSGNIVVLKIEDGKQIDEVIETLLNDANVEYAVPNYIRKPSSLSINDTYKTNLWGLENTGQSVVYDNGQTSPGTSGADIDMRRAWALSTGTSEVIVAVIDDGVAIDHPDLVDSMWNGASCKDENGGALGSCLGGYDFDDLDKNPSPNYQDSHGTHVAGTVAATQNNSKGISGVGPRIKIMALKTNYSDAETIKAIDFAIQNGAKVINASYGGISYNPLEKEAIDRFGAAGGIFVAASGNDDQDNEIIHHYPSDYTSSNIISVAATNQNDGLAYFSDYGTTSVDVGAPGMSVYSTVSYRKNVIQNFSNISDFNIDVGSSWARVVFGSGVSALLSDGSVMTGNYNNNTDYYITSDAIDLSMASGNPTDITFVAQCDDLGTTLAGDAVGDYMSLEVSGDGGTTAFVEVARWNEGYLSSVEDGGCSSGTCFGPMTVSIGNTYLTSDFKYRFRWVTDSSGVTDTGCFTHSMEIIDYPTNGANAEYDYFQGTSMAAPHVAGLAGYLWSIKPSAEISEIINSILSTGDTLSALDGKTTTGRRINAYNAVLSLGVTALSGPSVTGLTDDAVPAKSKSFSWSSATPSTDGYRFSIDQLISGVPTGSYSVGLTGTSYSSGSGTFYLHVQAQDADLAEGPVSTASFVLDNVGPSPTVSSSALNTFVLSYGETLYSNVGETFAIGADFMSRFTASSGIGLSVAAHSSNNSITVGVSGVPLAGSNVVLLSGTAANNFYDNLTNAGGTLAVFYSGTEWVANPSSLTVGMTYFPDLITTGQIVVGGTSVSSASSLTTTGNLIITVGSSGSNSSIGLTAGTIITELNDAMFDAGAIVGSVVDSSTVSGLGVGYTAVGVIQWGIPGTTLKFNQPVTVNLYLGSGFNSQTLYVYRSSSLSVGWTSSGLSSTTCVVSGGYCSLVTTEASYFLAASSPAPTPTPGPTSAPSSNNSNNNNNQSSGPQSGPTCNDRIPLFAPDLFKIVTTKGSAKIIFTPVNEKITGYAVIYGHKKGDERYAAMFSSINNNEGEQSFTINKLNPKLTYYFEVTAFNGCVSGPWSDWIPAKADRKREIHKYKVVVKNKVKTLVNKFL